MPKKKKPIPKGASPISGTKPPKKNQFGQAEANPRHNGAWKKEETLRYKFQQINKLKLEKLKALIQNDEYSEAEKAIAQTILQMREIEDPVKRWNALEGMMNQEAGYPKQQVENKNIEIQPILPMDED